MNSCAVSIVIVNWNVRDLLEKNLARLFAAPGRVGGLAVEAVEVIVVDNGSTDGSVAMLRERFPQVHLIRHEGNRGFARAVNQGCAIAQGEVIVLLNPDMLIGEDVLPFVQERLTADSTIGVLGVALEHEDGTWVESVRRDPGLWDQAAILLKVPHLLPRVLDSYLAKDTDYQAPQDVQQVRGSLFAFRRAVFEELGGFDAKSFFIWFEEVDFCKRARAAGYRVHYSPEVRATDLVGRSFAKRRVVWKQYHLWRSMSRYFRKWHPLPEAALITLLGVVAIGIGFAADVIGAKSRLWK